MARKKNVSQSAESVLTAKHLGTIANCLAYLIVRSAELKDKTDNDLIPILASLGFERSAIAAVLQTTPGTVSVRLSRLKAESKSKKTNKVSDESGKSSDSE